VRLVLLVTFVVFAFSASVPSYASTIPVFGTGLDTSGQFLPNGTQDPHYTLVVNSLGNGSNTYVPGGANTVEATTQAVPPGWPMINGVWVTDPSAQWIAPQTDVVAIPGVGMDTLFTYQTTFDLTGFGLSTVDLSGHWTGDNYISQVSLNGVPIYTASGCGSPGNYVFQSTTPFNISSGFVPGVNTLSFNVINSACFNDPPRTNPTGLLVDIAGTGDLVSAVPEPGAFLPAGVGLLFALNMYRRRRKTA